MKKYIFYLFTIIFFVSCTSSQKYLERQQFDYAIQKSAYKLMKKPTKVKEIDVLRRAWTSANQRDNENITYLRSTGQPNVWDKIFQIYIGLKKRQDIVRNLPQSVLYSIGYEYVDYTNETVNAQKNAAEFYYQKALSLMKNEDRISAREAYSNLLKTKQFFSNYKDVDNQLLYAQELGTTNVLFISKNSSGQIIPEGFLDEILKISLGDVENRFLRFYTSFDKSRVFHYKAILNLTRIDVSPERVENSAYEEFKQVQDGWNYVLDKKGNVMKDSLGNDIKTPKMVKIVCKVNETRLLKQALVAGYLDIYSSDNVLLRSDPISAETSFNYSFATANGDIGVLKEETKRKLKNRPTPFPSSFQMIWDAASIVKNISKDILVRNSYIFK